MQHWSCEQVSQDVYNFKFEGIRNTLMCSISRYDEFVRLSEQLLCLQDYKIVCNVSVSHNSVYIADNEGMWITYEVVEDE
jgi:hypothetical protein